MTDAELKFYKALQLCASDKHVIFTKVRIADVLSVAFPKTKESFGKWNGAFMKISQKHFDFVICDKQDMSFVCAVELNDKSHQRKDRTERDTFVIDACKQAGLPLLMQAWQPEYNLDELYLSLNTTIDEGKINKADSDNTDNDISHMPNIHAER
ncbi:DUF2726 domain-containing protein [Photobacterium leiognathi]|nr:DUF2726 domain-containing protein [Photobacterium leiognathi]